MSSAIRPNSYFGDGAVSILEVIMNGGPETTWHNKRHIRDESVNVDKEVLIALKKFRLGSMPNVTL